METVIEPKLEALALAAQQLRSPLNDIMLAADQLAAEGGELQTIACYLQKGVHQMHRILCNMADASRYSSENAARMEITELSGFFRELMEKLRPLAEAAGDQLQYTGPAQNVTGLADCVMLERAVSNLLSNAIKFSAPGSVLEAELTVNGDFLQFSVLDQANREESVNPANLFTRYQRTPTIEDSRRGIGLGLPLAMAIAAAHGGTVLIDHPSQVGTRVTMTVKRIPPNSTDILPTPLPVSDYAGGRDRGLLELSEVLPPDAFCITNH